MIGYIRNTPHALMELVGIRPLPEAPGVEYHVVLACSGDPRAIAGATRLLGVDLLSPEDVYERNVIKLGK